MLGDWSEATATWDNLMLNGNLLGGVQAEGRRTIQTFMVTLPSQPRVDSVRESDVCHLAIA